MPSLPPSARHPALGRLLFLAVLWGCAWPAGKALAAPPESPAGWIGYNLHRTNLPGGRWANVRTNRAMLIRGNGAGNRLVGDPLLAEPGC